MSAKLIEDGATPAETNDTCAKNTVPLKRGEDSAATALGAGIGLATSHAFNCASSVTLSHVGVAWRPSNTLVGNFSSASRLARGMDCGAKRRIYFRFFIALVADCTFITITP